MVVNQGWCSVPVKRDCLIGQCLADRTVFGRKELLSKAAFGRKVFDEIVMCTAVKCSKEKQWIGRYLREKLLLVGNCSVKGRNLEGLDSIGQCLVVG